MRAFTPSASFVAFFNSIIQAAEAPVTAGSYAPAIPDFANPEEHAFTHTKLAALIAEIHRMRQSLIVATPSNPILADPATAGMVTGFVSEGMSQAEAEALAVWFATQSTP